MLQITHDSLDWALKHIEAQGDTDLFPVPFEFAAIRHCWGSAGAGSQNLRVPLRDYLAKKDMHDWSVRPHRRCLAPKHQYGFRVATQLDPFDAILFTALVYDIGHDIERQRVPPSDGVVHSYRFLPTADGRFYDKAFGFNSFLKKSHELANTGKWRFVVLADIADFFPRIYSHPFENALDVSTSRSDHAKAIKNFLSQWNYRTSYGIPVGSAAARLLSELVLADVDAALLSEGMAFCRFSDDFRIFCEDERSSYRALAYLARVLFENHGLTLQQNKTRIVSKAEFDQINRRSETDQDGKSLSDRFSDILRDIGLADPYGDIEYAKLNADVQKKIDDLNLIGILREQAESKEGIDIGITQFVLRRLGQLDDAKGVDVVIDHVDHLYPVFKDVLAYLTAIRGIDNGRRRQIGDKLMSLVDDSIVGHLEFHRAWAFHTFTQGQEWDNEKRFATMINTYSDELSQRELILALGRSRQTYWFKTRKRDFQTLRPWERRAFLAAASCLPGDEGKFWYRSVNSQLDELERAVVQWAKANPF